MLTRKLGRIKTVTECTGTTADTTYTSEVFVEETASTTHPKSSLVCLLTNVAKSN